MHASHYQTMIYYVQDYWYQSQYWTGYWDEYNYNYFSGDSEDGSGGPYSGFFTYYGPGPSHTEYSDHIVFGNSEAWTQGDCNSMPTATITEFKAVGEGKTTKAYVTVSNNPGNATINLSLVPKSGQSGSAKFTSTGTSTRTITASGEVEIEGVSESSIKDSMRLKATYQGSGAPVTLDTEEFTVIQVTLTLNTTGNLASDNAASTVISTKLGTTTLGGPAINGGDGTVAFLMRHRVEIKAAILPTNFDQELTLQREILEFRIHTGSSLTSRDILCPDTSNNLFLDKILSVSGNVYDYDAPGFLVIPGLPNGTIVRRRVNFRQWLTVSQNYSNTGAQNVVMSGDLNWYQRLAVEKVSSSSQVLNTAVSGDNVVGTGSSNLDWDLSGTSFSTTRTGSP